MKVFKSPSIILDLMSVEVKDNNFDKEVLEKSNKKPVIVDFWAPWCPPCLMLAPVLEEAVKSFKGKVILVKANTNDCRAKAEDYRVKAIPNIKLFKKGRIVGEFVGFKPKEEIINWLKDNL
jgi:thioredoxin